MLTPKAFSRRNAISEETAALPWVTSESVARRTPRISAARVMVRLSASIISSRIVSPGWGGFFIVIVTFLSKTWAETVPVFVSNHSIGMHRYGDHVFFNGDGIIEISFTVLKLFETDYGVIDDFHLRLHLGFKDDVLALAVTYDGHWTLEECVDVNAETRTKIRRSSLAHVCSSCCFRILAMI